jgi:polysaccharide biosynthesis transport protein
MSRVSEALRRAGYQTADNVVSPSDGVPFVSAEDATEQVSEHVLPHSESETHYRHDEPADVSPPQARTESVRKGRADDIRIQEVLRVLNRRRWLIVAVVCLSLGVAVVYNLGATRIYEARARVLVEPTAQEVVPFRASTEDPGRGDYFVTQIDILRSQVLARAALERAGSLSKDPARQPAQVSGFLGALNVTTTRTESGESRVLNVMFRSPNPRLAAQMVNGLAAAYVDQNLDAKKRVSTESAKWLNQRVQELRGEVSSTDGALQLYREQKDAVSLDRDQNIVVQKLGQLNAALTAARAERVEKQTLYEQLAAIQRSGAPLDTFPPIGSNSFIQGMKAELAALQRERLQLAERLGELHPDMIKVNTGIENAQTRLNAETGKVVEGIQNDYRNAQAKERGLASALEAQERDVLNLNRESIGYNALQRDAAATQQMFNTVLQRAKETELAGELQSNNIRILDSAEIPRTPVWPRTGVNLAAAFLGGSFLALVLVFGLEGLNPRIADPEDIANALGLPLLGLAPKMRRFNENRTADLRNLPFPFQEAIRSIRTRLLLAEDATTPRTFVITSATPGEGKTLMASNIAVAIAMTGRRVLLVDADLRRPQLHSIFGVTRAPGLSDLLNGGVKPSEVLVESSTKGLFILPVGTEVPNAADLLDGDRLNPLIQGLQQVFDVVVIDSPPVLAVADASIVANAAVSVVFVVASGTTSQEVAQRAVDRLLSVRARVIGVVLNKAKVGKHSEYYYPYHNAESTA